MLFQKKIIFKGRSSMNQLTLSGCYLRNIYLIDLTLIHLERNLLISDLIVRHYKKNESKLSKV